MLSIPEDASSIACVVGIDPGSVLLGFAIIYFDVITKEIVKVEAFTINANKLPASDWVAAEFGDRYARISSLMHAIKERLDYYSPMLVACESSFINVKRPAAYGALTEVIAFIRHASMQYDICKPFVTIPPSSAKKTVGAKSVAKGETTKDPVKAAVLAKKEIVDVFDGEIKRLDEHALDAIIIAFTGLQVLYDPDYLEKMK